VTRPPSGGPERRRLSAGDRRTHLLDVAIGLLDEGGPEAVTMEGVAARAGVSKALGYRYFDNADELLLALYDREIADLRSRVNAALVGVTGFEEQVRASLTAWFDTLAERGTVIGTIMQAGPVSGPVKDRSRAIHASVSEFYGTLAADAYGLSPTTATVASSILLSGLEGLIDCWVKRRIPRRELIDIYTTMCVASLEALAAQPPLIGEPLVPTRPSARARARLGRRPAPQAP
jgi:AcrR family transcriptional regulator